MRRGRVPTSNVATSEAIVDLTAQDSGSGSDDEDGEKLSQGSVDDTTLTGDSNGDNITSGNDEDKGDRMDELLAEPTLDPFLQLWSMCERVRYRGRC